VSIDPGVLARARARVRGPVAIGVSEAAPAGMTLAVDGGLVWLLQSWPDGATPALLEEYDTAAVAVERAGAARRVLAAALADVLEVYVAMSRGDADLMRRWATGDLRRLADSGWLVLDEAAGTLRLGPRTALWPDESLGSLRDLVRRLPEAVPDEAVPDEVADE
jgi:hypothetical protein